MADKNILVAFGGMSPEHEVSVLTAMQVASALKETEFGVVPLYVTKEGRWRTGEALLELKAYQDLDALLEETWPCTFSHDEMGKTVLLETAGRGLFSGRRQYDLHAVIPAFHGSEGENGGFQGCCEMYNVPVAGSGTLASAVGMDKVKAKELCRAGGIPVVEGLSFDENRWEAERGKILEEAGEKLGYPVVIKPVNLGSSIGVARAEEREELEEAVETAFRYDEFLLVEKAVHPLLEVNCSVLGWSGDARASVCERPLGKEETLSFEDKYQADGGGKGMASADRVIPADIPGELSGKIRSLSLEIFRLFRASGVARLDFLVNEESHEVFFNEINTIPGSFSFYLWEEEGMNMTGLVLELIEIARKRHRRKMSRIRSYDTNLLSEKAVRGLKGLKGSGNQQAQGEA